MSGVPIDGIFFTWDKFHSIFQVLDAEHVFLHPWGRFLGAIVEGDQWLVVAEGNEVAS